MKPETKFRVHVVQPFLKTLRNSVDFSIQQVAIRGDPDKLLCIHGRFVALELKDVGEVPRPLQEEKLARVQRAGGLSLVADRENWSEIKNTLLKMSTDKEFAWKIQASR